MFVGYRNNVATYVAETLQEIKDLPCAKFDRIETVEFAEMFNNIIYTSEEALNNAKSNAVRAVRNQYLETYVDPIVSNPLRWGEMTAEEQQQYADYRRYLLDITDSAEFPNVQVMTLDEWKISQEPEEVSAEHGKGEEPTEATPEETI